MSLPEVIVYSKPSCCLCEEVKAGLARLRRKHDFAWREVNILEDRAAYEKFKNEIPVVFVGGKKAFKYRLDEKRFVRLLKAAAHEGDANPAVPNHSRG